MDKQYDPDSALLELVEDENLGNLGQLERVVGYLAANGHEPFGIAAQLKLEVSEVEQMLSSPTVQDIMFRVQTSIRLSPEQVLDNVLPLALSSITRIVLSNEVKTQDKFQAAKFLVEQAKGKAVQKVQVNSTLLDLKEPDRIRQAISSIDEQLRLVRQKKAQLQAAG